MNIRRTNQRTSGVEGAVRALLLLLLLAPLLADAQPVTFQPRAVEPTVGFRGHGESTWTTTGTQDIRAAGIPVKTGAVDRLNHHAAVVVIEAIEDGVVSELGIQVLSQVTRDGEDTEDLALDGLAVLGEGMPGDRSFLRADGDRLKKDQRKWFEAQFGHAGGKGEPDKDPFAILLPEGPVEPGDSWDLDMDHIQAFFGGRYTIDRGASHARATLVDVVDRHGLPTGLFDVDVHIVPGTMENAEFDTAAMALTGRVELPVQGDVPWFAYDITMKVDFDGIFKKGLVRAKAVMDLTMHGKEAHRPPST